MDIKITPLEKNLKRKIILKQTYGKVPLAYKGRQVCFPGYILDKTLNNEKKIIKIDKLTINKQKDIKITKENIEKER